MLEVLDHRPGGLPGSRGEARAPSARRWEFGSWCAGQHRHPAGGNGRQMHKKVVHAQYPLGRCRDASYHSAACAWVSDALGRWPGLG